MIPDHVLSTQNFPGSYLRPDDNDVSPVLEFELGGIALNDISEGLMYQTWTATLSYKAARRNNGIFLSAENTEEFLFLDEKGITEFSFTFDQNMNPFIAYVQNGEAKFHWWDPTIPGYTTVSLPEGSSSPKCCMDDKRYMQTSRSDIILIYIRAGNLYYREQRDRFNTEYLLKESVVGECLIVGMSKKLRLQVALGAQDFPDTTLSYRNTVNGRRRVTVGGNPRRIPGVNYGY